MKTRIMIAATLLAITAPCHAEKYELDDPSGRQFLPDPVNNMIDRVDRFKERLDAMSDNASNTYGNAKERLNNLLDTGPGGGSSAGYSTSSKQALESMGSGTTAASATNPAYAASLDVRAKQYNLEQQRNRCVTMRTGSETQAQCDLKALCMEDDLKRTKAGYGMPTESPNMAAGQCNGPNPVARAQSGDATLMGMLGTNGTPAGFTSPLDGLMQDQQKQEAAAAEAKRQEERRRQQVALAEQQRQAEIQRQQQVAAVQVEAASSDDGMVGMAMGVLGAAASAYAGSRGSGGYRPSGGATTGTLDPCSRGTIIGPGGIPRCR